MIRRCGKTAVLTVGVEYYQQVLTLPDPSGRSYIIQPKSSRCMCCFVIDYRKRKKNHGTR